MSTSARSSPPPSLSRGLPERYRLRRHLATGGMAAVWCAEDRVLGRQVAIKVLADRFAHDERAVRRFKREARAAARVSAHPHVVTIFDVGDLSEPAEGDEDHAGAFKDPSGAFIVMEHLAGGTVADALRHDAVTREEARRWLREAAEALDHAHARGIVHRDIKPANFLLDQGRGLHVADFGIARLASEDTITSAGELFGTAAYLAPEQALGEEATAASDRYALAIAAFELLTGGRPFTAEHFAAQARQHIEAEPPRASERVSDLPPAVDAVLARGMAKQPDERYPTSVGFVAALEAALDGEQTAMTTPLPLVSAAEPATAAIERRAARPDRRARAEAAGDRRGPAKPTTERRGRADAVPSAGPRGRSGRAVALLALLVVVAGVALVIAGLGATGSQRSASSRRASVPARRHHAAPPARPTAGTHRSSSATSSTTAPTSSTAPTTTAAAPAPPPTAADLQLLGYHERLAGNYPAAIAADRRALAAADPSSLTYAYALYDLGVSLLKSGSPAAAIPYLQQRLKYNNQTTTVQAALNQALRAAGRSPATGGASLPAGQAKKHGGH